MRCRKREAKNRTLRATSPKRQASRPRALSLNAPEALEREAEISARLTLSYNTVKSRIRHIYDKLDVHRRQDLVDLIAREAERLS